MAPILSGGVPLQPCLVLNAFPTDVHHTDTLVLSLEVSDDDDEDFIQHNHSYGDRCPPTQYGTLLTPCFDSDSDDSTL